MVASSLVKRTPQTAATHGLTANAGMETCRRSRFYAKRGKGLRGFHGGRVSLADCRAPTRPGGTAHLARKSRCLSSGRAGGLTHVFARFAATDCVQESRFSTARLCELDLLTLRCLIACRLINLPEQGENEQHV